MLKELVHDKINEVFLIYQEALNITDGAIDPFDAVYLDRLEEQLVNHIARVCAKQPRETKSIDYADLRMEQLEQM